jgi:hypothetical protein
VTNALERLRAVQLNHGSDSKGLGSIFRTADSTPFHQRRVKHEIATHPQVHTAATLAIAAGLSVKVIAEQLGHASISIKFGDAPMCCRVLMTRLRRRSSKWWRKHVYLERYWDWQARSARHVGIFFASSGCRMLH